MKKPILCLDFDGVIHSYTSPWTTADEIRDPPVPGAMQFIWEASEHYTIAIFSSRSNQPGGLEAMQQYLLHWMAVEYASLNRTRCAETLAAIDWPLAKPAAFLTIDDRALTFTGIWPAMEQLRSFKPWNKMMRKEA